MPANASQDWERYVRALHATMSEVLADFPDEVRPHALEVADYWVSVGLLLGLEHRDEARRLLGLIEANETELAALAEDAAAFLQEALS